MSNTASELIELTLVGDHGQAMRVTASPYFRITGGAIWIGPSAEGERPLARYVAKHWEHEGVLWRGLRFEGKCRLVFGVPSEPTGVSEEIAALSIHGDTLSANGIPFAVYAFAQDMWGGARANTWWHAFRVESASIRDPARVSKHKGFESPAEPAADPNDRSRRLN